MSFNVLICDDSVLARKMAKKCLPEGFASTIHQASNGVEALSILDSQPVEVVLLDLTMPVLDGVGVLEAIKQRNLDVFVVVVSGDIQPQMREKVLQLGALDFVPKPVNPDLLQTVFSRYGLY